MLVVLTFAASACGSGSHTASTGLKSAAFHALPRALRAYIRSGLTGSKYGPTHEIDVYGPGRHAALEQAAMGDKVTDPDRTKDFYLVVQHGTYVCGACSSPSGRTKPPHGTIETFVWSARKGQLDFGFGSGLPPAMSRLHPIAEITLS